jgi:amidase
LRNPAHYCGIYAHKPSRGLIPIRGHSPAGALAPIDISVVGPMARDARDLELAMRVLAGPDGPQQAAWRVELPAPRHRRLGEFRIAAWAQSPLCEVDAGVADRFEAVIAALARAGAAVDRRARPAIDDAEHHRLFTTLLFSAIASRLDDRGFAAQQAIAATLTPADKGFGAGMARGATLMHRDWAAANEARTKLRYLWREFFGRFDALLTPVAATAAFTHDHNPDKDARLVPVNGKALPYLDQIFWAGLASLCYLPATAAPTGLTAAGLPVGVQIIGAEGDDLTTIECARLLAAEIGGFIAPPGYA